MMSHGKLPLFAGVTLLVGVQTGSSAVQAATHRPSNGLSRVVDVVLESGDPQQTLQTGYTTMETATVNCKYSTCSFAMSVMANIGNATCTQKEWAINGLVDGTSVDGGPDVGAVPASGVRQSRSWQGFYQTGYGRHVLAFQLNVPCAVTAYQWSVDYAVTTP